ncbi:hypothetical protein BCV69DRAFT_72834 [Microstroma glucosiphilum]|uniref:Uncharacterized protein n=1 Tax=Pseudomicrostroma glucosiphilum TaxID=1684307 RepID=A0A316U628_9BASI|nr:hypothetical protein BCV69DRAFT_72834 [Pseudomicrostroma glucosiphilum]PWN18415.1 hypothetical protein BCV69DRAFT_72834 [Pseudomicrostroma glucosiphilum]
MSTTRPLSALSSYSAHFRATSTSTMDASFELLEPIEEDGEEEDQDDQTEAHSSRHSHLQSHSDSDSDPAGSSHRTTSTSSLSIHAVFDASTSDGIQEELDEERLQEVAGRRSTSSGPSPLEALLNLSPSGRDGPNMSPRSTDCTDLEIPPPTKTGAISPPSGLNGIPGKILPGNITFPSTERNTSKDRPLPAPPTSASTPSQRASSNSSSVLPTSTGERTYDAILSAMRKSAEAAKVAAEKEGRIAEEAARKAKRAALDAREALVEAANREGKRALAAVEKVSRAGLATGTTTFTNHRTILRPPLHIRQAKTYAEQAVALELAEQKKAEDAARAEIARLHVSGRWIDCRPLHQLTYCPPTRQAESSKLKAAAKAAEAVLRSQAVAEYEAQLSRAQRKLDSQRRAKEAKARRQAEKRQYKVSLTRRKASAKAAAVLAIAVDEACERRMEMERAAWKERSRLQEAARAERQRIEREVQLRAGKVGKDLLIEWEKEKTNVLVERKRRVLEVSRERKTIELQQEPLLRRKNALAAGHKDGIRLDRVAYDAGRPFWKNWLVSVAKKKGCMTFLADTKLPHRLPQGLKVSLPSIKA